MGVCCNIQREEGHLEDPYSTVAGGSLSLLSVDGAAFLTLAVLLVAFAADGSCPSLLTSDSGAAGVDEIEVIIFLYTRGAVLSSPISSLCASAAPLPRWRTRGASSDKH